MLYREIIAVCSQIHTKHLNTLCGQNVELLNVKLVVRIVSTGLQRVTHLSLSEIFLKSLFWAILIMSVLKKVNWYCVWHRLFPVTIHNTVTGLWAGQSGVQLPAGQMIFLFNKTSWPFVGPTQLSIQYVSKFFPSVQRLESEVTNHLYVVPRLRTSGAIPQLPLYDFMAWRGTTFLFCAHSCTFLKQIHKFTGKC